MFYVIADTLLKVALNTNRTLVKVALNTNKTGHHVLIPNTLLKVSLNTTL